MNELPGMNRGEPVTSVQNVEDFLRSRRVQLTIRCLGTKGAIVYEVVARRKRFMATDSKAKYHMIRVCESSLATALSVIVDSMNDLIEGRQQMLGKREPEVL